MPTSTNVTNLKINELTEAQYDAAVQGGVIGENELSVITDMDIDAIQVSTMPTAAAGELGNIYQFVGTTDANYTNGYFYKCVSDGQDPATYSWTQTDVQPQAGGLPSQTGQSGKFLTTDGTDASWSDTPLVNSKLNTAQNAVGILGYAGANTSIAIGSTALTTGAASVAVGESTQTSGAYSTAIGYNARTSKLYAIQLGYGTNDEQNTFRVGLAGGAQYNYKLLDSDGTIPADRLPNAINKYSTMPTAASTNVGWIVQFTGTTDSTYTHGYIYECKAQGTTPETYAWEAVTVQAGGGSSLPSQTGNSGKFLTTDGTDASWSDKPIVNTSDYKTKQVGILGAVYSSDLASACGIAIGYSSESRGTNRSIAIGSNSVSGRVGSTGSSVALGYLTEASGGDGYSAAIGTLAKATATGAIQFGNGTNSTPGTLSVGLQTQPGGSAATNYRLLNSDGTIPAARHATLPAADGTYTLQLVIADGVPTLSWVAV